MTSGNNAQEKVVKIVFFLLVAAISIHLAGYHISKTLMDIAGIISLGYIAANLKICFYNLNKQDFIWVSILLALPSSYAFSYYLHGSELDYEYTITTLRASTISSVIYIILRLSHSVPLAKINHSIFFCMFTAGAAGTYTWSQYNFSEWRISVGTNLINIYATVLATTIIISAYNLASKNFSVYIRYLYSVGIILGIGGVMASGSRTAIIALILALLVITIRKTNAKHRKTIVSVIGVTTILIIYSTPIGDRLSHSVSNFAAYFDQSTYLQYREKSIGLRLDMWKGAIQEFANKPLLGNGSWSLSKTLSQQLNSGQITNTINGFDNVHNDFIQALLSRGVLGGTILFLLFYYPYLNKNNIPEELQGVLLAMLSIYFLSGLTDAVMLRATSLSFYLIVISIVLASARKSLTYNQESEQ